MENCARGGGGVNGTFSVSDKEAAAASGGAGNGNVVAVGSYGLLNKNIMMSRHIHHHHDNGFDGGDGGSGGDAGPTSSAIPLFTVGGGGGGGGGGAVAVRLSQPFNTSPLPFKSPGMASALGFPFTCAQWKELERQAMVYKYMMASVPVPPDLLLPISTNTYTACPTFHTQSSVGYSGKNRDLEPGRCKRTDGKKWRCSKEVAPNQKYCDRHLHRGRPRSRKPVEDHTLPANTTNNNTKKTRLQQPSPLESPSMVISQPAITSDKHNEVPQSVDARMDHTFPISPFSEQHRSLDWEFVAMGGSEEQWQQLMAYESSVYNNRDNNGQIFQPMNLLPCKDYYGFLNPDLGSLDKEFVNAWANGNISNNSNILESEMGILESDEHNNMFTNLTYRSPVSWVPFGSGGGPLAEVLKPSHHHHHHPSSSSYISNGGDSVSPAGTTVSSPSGVLQKTTLFSQSDGSVCNSPTLAAAEMAPPFQWLS